MTKDTGLQLFDPIRADIEKIREHNATVAFDYESPTGNKMARSHVFALRKVKSRISDAHKIAKADALEVSRALDKLKRDLIGDVETMIEVHDAPLREIDDREKKKVLEEAARVQAIKDAEEKAKQDELAAREKAIADKEEALRLKEEAQVKAEREKAIADQAAAQAIEQEQQRNEREREAEQRAAEQERKRIEQEQERKRVEEECRTKDEAHRATVQNEAHRVLLAYCDGDTAIAIVRAIDENKIPHVTITY